jgi:hypothetical protein
MKDKYMFYKELIPIAIGIKTKISESPPERLPDHFFRAGIIRAGVAIFSQRSLRDFASVCSAIKEYPFKYLKKVSKGIKRYQMLKWEGSGLTP